MEIINGAVPTVDARQFAKDPDTGIFTPVSIDAMSKGQLVIANEHHEIHEGDSYVATDFDSDVDIAGPKYWRLTVANTTIWPHLIIQAAANAAGTLELFETPTEDEPVVPGTALTAYNANRNSSNTAGLVIKYDPVFTADGNRIWHTRLGSTGVPVSSSGGTGAGRKEIILKQNTTYAVKFTTDAENNLIWIEFDWYELESA